MARLCKAVAVASVLAVPALAEEIEIVALGDSLTQGYGLIAEEGFVPQMEAWLRARDHDVRLVNAGVSGDTTAGGLARVAWSLGPETDALVVALGGNDMLRGLPPDMTRANLDGIVKAATGAGVPVLLVGMQAPGNYGPEYKAAFDRAFPEVAQAHGALLAPSFFEGVGGEDPAALRALLQADGIHPNATGVVRIVEGLGPHFERLIAVAEEGR